MKLMPITLLSLIEKEQNQTKNQIGTYLIVILIKIQLFAEWFFSFILL